MLIAKIYGLLWLITAAVGGVLYSTDSFSGLISIAFGFIVAALGGAAILVAFPAMMTERVSSRREARQS